MPIGSRDETGECDVPCCGSSCRVAALICAIPETASSRSGPNTVDTRKPRDGPGPGGTACLLVGHTTGIAGTRAHASRSGSLESPKCLSPSLIRPSMSPSLRSPGFTGASRRSSVYNTSARATKGHSVTRTRRRPQRPLDTQTGAYARTRRSREVVGSRAVPEDHQPSRQRPTASLPHAGRQASPDTLR